MNRTQSKAKKKLERSLEQNQEPSKYQQRLYKIIEPIDKKVINKINKKKGWVYGYNDEYDIVVISRDGMIGDIYEIQGLRIAIPKAPEKVHGSDNKKEDQYWQPLPVPAFIAKTKSIFQFNKNADAVKMQWSSYIGQEFDRREEGFWFMNNGEPTYITGTHYMYLQWTKTDAEIVEYRKANQLFFFFWEACKADRRSYGMIYLKNRRSGFSYMAASETVNLATLTKDSRYGMLSKSGADAKKLFTDKVVPMANNYPFFFKPIQDGMEKPKTELLFRVPSKKHTAKSYSLVEDEEENEGLDTSIDWKNTGDYSYDGEKLKLLVHDESGKWEKPDNVKANWRVTKTCLRLGNKVVGKCMMGSTAGALDSGGEEFKSLYNNSNLLEVERNKKGQTSTGLYALFIPMEWNYEGCIDKYGNPVFNTPEDNEEVLDIWGDPITMGSIDDWEAEVEGLKVDPDALNAYYRQYPRTEQHAFRDESENSIFNLTRLYDQLEYNGDDLERDGIVTRGDFAWENGVQDTRVIFHPHSKGRFFITKLPPPNLQNNVEVRKGIKYPGNEHMGSFGCDPYDISGTVGKGSNGALHGLSKNHMEDFPINHFFLEYISRPPTAEIFFEDVLMAIVFYGMPILVENNKPGLLKHLARRGYRGFSMNRPDRKMSQLSPSERELGGVPNSGPQMIHDHANAINTYIERNVGWNDDNIGDMYFNRTLKDWLHFDITKRGNYDASISSGFAIMANQRLNYRPNVRRDRDKTVKLNLGQRGRNGQLIYGNKRHK